MAPRVRQSRVVIFTDYDPFCSRSDSEAQSALPRSPTAISCEALPRDVPAATTPPCIRLDLNYIVDYGQPDLRDDCLLLPHSHTLFCMRSGPTHEYLAS